MIHPEQHTRAELANMAEDLGLPTTGTKADLAARVNDKESGRDGEEEGQRASGAAQERGEDEGRQDADRQGTQEELLNEILEEDTRVPVASLGGRICRFTALVEPRQLDGGRWLPAALRDQLFAEALEGARGVGLRATTPRIVSESLDDDGRLTVVVEMIVKGGA